MWGIKLAVFSTINEIGSTINNVWPLNRLLNMIQLLTAFGGQLLMVLFWQKAKKVLL